jgi:hypothetical protein
VNNLDDSNEKPQQPLSTLCDSNNKWNLPEKQEKAKACLVCGLPLTQKEASENPEYICNVCYSIGES